MCVCGVQGERTVLHELAESGDTEGLSVALKNWEQKTARVFDKVM